MKSILKRVTILTGQDTELINITPNILAEVEHSGIRNGTVFVMSLHTTTGITVNEGLPDIETDIVEFLRDVAPDRKLHHHSRFLHSDGQMAVNATSHLRGALLGFEVFFPIEDGRIVTGSRQTVYLVELDGPQERTYVIHLVGE